MRPVKLVEGGAMGWRKILEAEHRLMLEVAEAAEAECRHIEATGAIRLDLVGDMIGFFRYFGDGLHHPKEEALLFARCHRRGMTDEDEPLEQMIGEHEWCRVKLDGLEQTLERIDPGDRAAALDFAARLREYLEVARCHVEVEEDVFFDTAQHYLTESDRHELTEEFEAVHWDEIEEGVSSYWEDLAHRLWVAEAQSA
jgi:hemerythrin-like domain-containing protein